MRYGLLAVVLFAPLVALVIGNFVWPLQIPVPGQGGATVVLDADGVPLRAFADKQGVWRQHIALDDVSPLYLEALIHYEDQYFYWHPGINPASLMRAFIQNWKSGRIVSGGSTLTMQVSRILYPHSRSLWGKASQMLRALQLEWMLSKQQILELYINHAPFGGVFEGVQAASFQYLGKPATQLRHSEAALLAVLPQAPSRYRPDRHPEKARQARDKVLTRLLDFDIWSREVVTAAKQEGVMAWAPQSPMSAPILSRRLTQNFPDKSPIETFIDGDLQQALQDYVRDYVSSLGQKVSAAILLVENQTNTVKAYVGSADFYSVQKDGQVDMVQAVRSPGSTLKPFLYGMAIDDYLIHSASLLADVPWSASHYRPGNFTHGFSGPVSASEALQRSLNVPFVQLINAYGAKKFSNRLRHVGADLVIPGGTPNPSIIIGGAGLTLESLVSLYSSLANNGYVKPLRMSKDDAEAAGRRLMSPEAAWMTRQALKNLAVPVGFDIGITASKRPEIAWKTGTSWGHRDVWAVGVGPRYSVGVWLGRPDGHPLNEQATGFATAGPLLFTVFDQLPSTSSDQTKPPGVKQLVICWPDGRNQQVAYNGCDQKHLAYTRAGVTPRTLMPEQGRQFYHPQQTIQLDPSTGAQVTLDCNQPVTEHITINLWPAALDPWLPSKFRRESRLPDFQDDCVPVGNSAKKIRLTGIEPDQMYVLSEGENITEQLVLGGAVAPISWYINGVLYQETSTKLDVPLPSLGQGTHHIKAIDRLGSVTSVDFTVLR